MHFIILNGVNDTKIGDYKPDRIQVIGLTLPSIIELMFWQKFLVLEPNIIVIGKI